MSGRCVGTGFFSPSLTIKFPSHLSLKAAPYLKRLVAGFPPRRSGFALGSHKWDLWWTKWRRGRFSPSTSISPAKTIHSTNFSIIIITITYIYIRENRGEPHWGRASCHAIERSKGFESQQISSKNVDFSLLIILNKSISLSLCITRYFKLMALQTSDVL
jgi:hypothetical protein